MRADKLETQSQLMQTDRVTHCPLNWEPRGVLGGSFWVDGRQPFRYAPERPTTGKVRIARQPLGTQKSGQSYVPHCSVSELAIWHQLRNANGAASDRA